MPVSSGARTRLTRGIALAAAILVLALAADALA